MAVPAHKTEYFIIENSNLQKKANTAIESDKDKNAFMLYYIAQKRSPKKTYDMLMKDFTP